MLPEQEEQLRNLLGEHESNDIPKSLRWKAMEPRLFPDRRPKHLIWLFSLFLLVAIGIFIWLTGDTAAKRVSPPAVASASLDAAEATVSIAAKDDSQDQDVPAVGEGTSRPPVSTSLGSPPGRVFHGQEVPFLLPARLSAVAMRQLPSLPIPLLGIRPVSLPEFPLQPKRIITVVGPPRRFFSLAVGPGTLSIPLQPIGTLPRDMRVESTFANARSLQLRIDVLRRGPVTLTTGLTFRTATNTLTPSTLSAGQEVTADLSSLHLPLLVGYQYGTGRWTFQAATGPSIEVGRWTRGETLLRSGVVGPAAAIYADTPAVPLALTGELGVEYRLWPRLGLTMGVSYARGGTRLQYSAFERPSRQEYRGGVVGVVFYPRG